MALSCSPPLAIVPHVWATHYVSTSSELGYDAYFCLGLCREDLSALLDLLTGPPAQCLPLLSQRAASLKRAYKEAVSRLHPDAQQRRGQARKRTCTWLPDSVKYATVVEANGRVSDPLSACRYLLLQPWATAGWTAEQRTAAHRTVALLFRERQVQAVSAHRRAFLAAAAASGAPPPLLIVVLALYGDLHAAGLRPGGSKLDMVALAKHAAWLERPATTEDGDSSAVMRCRLGVAAGAAVTDVTTALQAAVEQAGGGGSAEDQQSAAEQHLVLRGFVHAVEGCWDPCPGYPKQLALVYAFRGRVHVAVVEDGETLHCPLKRHAVEGVSAVELLPLVHLGACAQSPVSPRRSGGLRAGDPNTVARLGATAAKAAAKLAPTATARRRVEASKAAVERACELQRTFQTSMAGAATDLPRPGEGDAAPPPLAPSSVSASPTWVLVAGAAAAGIAAVAIAGCWLSAAREGTDSAGFLVPFRRSLKQVRVEQVR